MTPEDDDPLDFYDVRFAEPAEAELEVEYIREALASGPGKPIEQYLTEQRAKHGYPDTWPLHGAVSEIAPGLFVDSGCDKNRYEA